MISKESINFLSELKTNNNREWFLNHQMDYKLAKDNFTGLIASIIAKIGKKHKEYNNIDATKCLFRINRDVRFSANKAPYKTNFGASIHLFGKKSPKAGFYVHIEPGASFVGGGVYMPPSDVLFKVRQEIDYNLPFFLKIVKHKDFVKHYGGIDMSDSLTNPPRGFEKENPAIEFLKLKSFVATAHFNDKAIIKSDFVEAASEKLIALIPLINFINKCLDD
jgi:uncharacterized protein (TIGR02453 family)